MTPTSTEDRIRSALDELAATTTTGPDAWEQTISRAVYRRGRPFQALIAAAAVSVAIAGLVVIAVALRDESGNRVATQPPATTSPQPGGTTWITDGELDGAPWKLTTRRTRDGDIEVLFESGTTSGTIGRASPGLMTTLAVRGGNDPVSFIFGVTPPTAVSVRLTLPDGSTKLIDVFGDEMAIGGRLFVTSSAANTAGNVSLEALDAAGNAIGVSSLAFRGGVVAVPDGCPADVPTPATADDDAVAQAALTYARTTRGWEDAEVYGLYPVGSGRGYDPVYAHNIPLFCGQAIADASYGVDFRSPSRLPESVSTSHGSVVVAHFEDGWRVWGFYR